MLKTKVYIKSVTSLTDARYCAGMGVDYIGFCIDSQSEHFVSPEKFNEIKNWLVGVQLIAEIPSLQLIDKSIVEITADYSIAGLLTSDISDLATIKNAGLLTFIEKESNSIADYTISTEIGQKSFLKVNSVQELNVLSDNFEEIAGICVESTDEIRPGFKDMDTLIEILEFIED